MSFSSFTSNYNTGNDIALLLGVTLVLKIAHTIMAYRKSNVVDVIHPKGSAIKK